MGLDVYLYRYEDFAATEALEKQAESWSEHAWDAAAPGKKYEQMTDAEKDAARASVAAWNAEHGLDEDGSDPRKARVEIPSALHPDHYFKVGYFRSSYNDGGIDRILRNLLGTDLADLFPVADEEDRPYAFRPDWRRSLDLTRETLGRLRATLASDGAFKVHAFTWNEFDGPPNAFPVDSQEKALAKFQEVRKQHLERTRGREPDPEFDMNTFSCSAGLFCLGKPWIFRGFIRGVADRFFADEKLPCTYGVYEAEDGLEWYVQALEIVAETCEYVLARPDPEKYHLHWSG